MTASKRTWVITTFMMLAVYWSILLAMQSRLDRLLNAYLMVTGGWAIGGWAALWLGYLLDRNHEHWQRGLSTGRQGKNC